VSEDQQTGELARYARADPETRKLIRQIMKRQYRLAREPYWLNILGLSSGFIIAIAFLAVSGWLINGDHAVAGTILGTVDIIGLVSVFVYANTVQRRDSQPPGLPPGQS
jgi:uncharacterized membrane protein YhaH (DUF805 family)